MEQVELCEVCGMTKHDGYLLDDLWVCEECYYHEVEEERILNE